MVNISRQEGEDVDSYNEEIDDFYVVDSRNDKPNPDFKPYYNVGNDILSKEEKLSRRKPTEGEIDAFLENIKQSNFKCGTSGLEGSIDNSFGTGKMSGDLSKMPKGSSRDKLCAATNRAAQQSPESFKRFKHLAISYKPDETRKETVFAETSVYSLSRSINDCKEIGFPSSDSLFHVSFDRNEDFRGGFSDLKGSQYTNGRCDSSTMEFSSHHLRRDRSRSPYVGFSRRFSPVRENRFPSREDGSNHSYLDDIRTDRSVHQDRKYYNDLRRHRRSRSRSRERKPHSGRSYEHRRSRSFSPTSKRKSGNSMEGRLPPYYQSSGTPMPPSSSFMNPDPNSGISVHGPVQYPLNSVSSNPSLGRFPGYNAAPNNLFNSNHTQPQSFLPPIAQNQYPDPQNYNAYNPVMQANTSNTVPYPAPWNQSSSGLYQNYTEPNVSNNAVMYPHLKIGQSRMDIHRDSQRESLDGSPLLKQNKSSLEKRMRSASRSPDSKKHKKKSSKRYSKSPSLENKYEDIDDRYGRLNKSPFRTLKHESKKPKVIIDPNRIPTPPPPPIVGSYNDNQVRKPIEHNKKTVDNKSDVNRLTDFLNKEKVSLSCLLEAVMETSGQGKSRLSDPKVKKEIISNCESKIQHLYKRRMTGLGAFIPDPVDSSPAIAHASPLVSFYSSFSYNCEEEDNEWRCPDIIVPQIKMKDDLKVATSNFTSSQMTFEAEDKHLTSNIENPATIPILSSKEQSLHELNWNANQSELAPPQPMFTHAFDNNQQDMFSSHQGPVPWNNAVPPPNPYLTQPPIPCSTNEYSSAGSSPYMPPNSYPFPHRSPGSRYMSEHGYPPQRGMLNYSSRMDYPPAHHFPPSNLNHPGLFNAPQPDDIHKLRKNVMLNDNLILLSNHVSQKEGKGRKENDHPPGTKEKLGDTPLDTFHDYQLANLKERIETCLAEGKSSPGLSQHKIKDRREGDRERDRHRDRDRGRDRFRDYGHPRRSSMEGERRRHSRSPHGDERKKRKSTEDHENCRKSKEPSDKKDHRKKLSGKDDVIEILSDEEHGKHKLSDSSTNERLMDPDDHLKPSEKSLIALVFDSLGPEIRKIQEKSDLYKSIIETLDKGDKTYKRLYSFRNHALVKSEKDNRMKMVIPRDNLKDVVMLIHKNLHHVQSEELSRLLKNIAYPYKLYIPKCIAKVISECPVCIEEKKKNDEQLSDKKSESSEIKTEKRGSRSLRDRDRDLRSSRERYIRGSKRRSSSSSRGRRDPLKSGKDKDRKHLSNSDGRPLGYEKATKVRKPDASSDTKHDEITSDEQCLIKEKSIVQNDVKFSEQLHGLSDKALEFKQISESYKDIAEGSILPEGFNQQSLSVLVKENPENTLPCNEIYYNNSEVKDPKSERESSGLISQPDIGSSDILAKPEVESSIIDNKFEMDSNNTNNKLKIESLILDKKPEIESNNTAENPMILDNKPKMESDNSMILDNKPEIESNNLVEKIELESSDTKRNDEVESSNRVTTTEMETSEEANNLPKSKESVVSISEPAVSSKVDLIANNKKLKDSSSDTVDKVNTQSNKLEVSQENNFTKEKASINQKKKDDDCNAAPRLDFKGRVRQVQMLSNECKNIMIALESNDCTVPTDPSYLIKGGMLCRKDTTGYSIEVKIVTPSDELEKIVNIVHTMSAAHTPLGKVVAFFSKHFTQVDNLDLKVKEVIDKCAYCKLKSS